jgi:PAS domain S-box-containing protein
MWLEATGRNMLADPAIKGLVVNSRDITERLLAEKESRMRGQMQALSENSPDLITRFNKDGKVFYINPIIETYSGKEPSDFLNKEVTEVDLEGSLAQQWLKIIGDVIACNDKISLEMDFPSQLGDRVMQVNAIPEYNENETIESVLMVSHDITDRKLIELEIQTKNKKITESINYAKRIQGAILPDTDLINKVLPESFILYKAKDVVSGDFPWFVQMGDDIYLAAVDCTGHGVPGALISLIGYFLLNDIVKSRKISTPGLILDQLDEAVTKTLRQDTADSKTKDGMDIALCKINLKTNTVEYAGAHRPLYYMTAEGLTEIKGDKFPIGGGIYKNQTNFANTVLNVKKGESIFFCSDGFPDQFGGTDNTKFGPRRIREIISNNYNTKLNEVCTIFDHEWEAWKGQTKQTDDVLMIGVKF